MSIDEFKMAWQLRQARQAAKKYKLDFDVRCVFDHQLKQYGYPKHKKLCKIKMQSGKVALYMANIVDFCDGGTGQKNWHFEFHGYNPDSINQDIKQYQHF